MTSIAARETTTPIGVSPIRSLIVARSSKATAISLGRPDQRGRSTRQPEKVVGRSVLASLVALVGVSTVFTFVLTVGGEGLPTNDVVTPTGTTISATTPTDSSALSGTAVAVGPMTGTTPAATTTRTTIASHDTELVTPALGCPGECVLVVPDESDVPHADDDSIDAEIVSTADSAGR